MIPVNQTSNEESSSPEVTVPPPRTRFREETVDVREESGNPPRRPSETWRGLRPSFSISNLGRGSLTANPLTHSDRTSEKTDEMVHKEIRDSELAYDPSDESINLGKLGVKLSPPEYEGGETIDEFLKFMRELLNFLSIYSLLKPEADLFRVKFLGQILKGKALKWYQHMINSNADRSWKFEETMVALKWYFIRDASSRDATMKFDCLSQKGQSVTELKKDLERLSQQMIQTPSDYDMARRFLSALKPEISTKVVRHGYNPENSNLNAIFEAAKFIEEAHFYETWEERDQQKYATPKTFGSKSSKSKDSSKKQTNPKAPEKGAYDKSNNNDLKTIKCYYCKQKGHTSPNCPKKNSRYKKSANIEALEGEEHKEGIANAADAEEASDAEELYTSAEEAYEVLHESASGEDGDNDELSLEDWCACTRINEPTDSENKPVTSDIFLEAAVMRLLDNGNKDHVESSKVTEMGDQVAYRLRSTKDVVQNCIEDGPKRDFRCLGVIEGYMHINGQKAHILLDGGSMLDMISVNFATVNKLDMFQLKKPVKLQMATSGSRSVINYGVRAELKVGNLKQNRYFDIVNLDRYQVILGMPFLKEHNVLLNYAGSGSFKLGDKWFPV